MFLFPSVLMIQALSEFQGFLESEPHSGTLLRSSGDQWGALGVGKGAGVSGTLGLCIFARFRFPGQEPPCLDTSVF